MQTFLPFSNFGSVKFLDRSRLGKQRVEVLQMLKAIISNGRYAEHVVSRSWRGHEHALAQYGLETCQAWIERGYKDSCFHKIAAFIGGDLANVKLDKTGQEVVTLVQEHGTFSDTGLPWWIGDERVHSSHRARLLAKDEEHYRQFGWTETPAETCFYPLPLKSNKK
jgi:hypothetical protein